MFSHHDRLVLRMPFKDGDFSSAEGPQRPAQSMGRISFALNFNPDVTIFSLSQIAAHIELELKLNSPLLSRTPDCGLYLQPGTKQVGIFTGDKLVQVVSFENDALSIIESEDFLSVLSCGEPLLFSGTKDSRAIDWFIADKIKNEAIHLTLYIEDGQLEPKIGFIGQEWVNSKCQITEGLSDQYPWMPANFGLKEYLSFLKLNYGELPKI